MKTLAEQIANKCVHFNGLGSDRHCCRAGVAYTTVEDKTRAGLGRYPCFRDGEAVPCPKRHFPTPEEVAADVVDRNASMERLMLGVAACQADAKQRGFGKGSGGNGSVPCPVCKAGKLAYSVAGYNGHMHGRCETPGCVSWMQ